MTLWAVCAPGRGLTEAAVDLDPVTVIATAPLPGLAVDIDKSPSRIESLSSDDIARSGPADLAGALEGRLAGVSLGDTLDDPFQPDLTYRGFAASPVLGASQGLAVYQNGARINEAFGDGVNWDVIPELAIRRVTLTSSNPVYGLNALGGAVALEMKSGFSDPGGVVELSGGDFGRRGVAVQYGAVAGDLGLYAAFQGLKSDGWRVSSSDLVRRGYISLAARPGPFRIELTYSGADNRLDGASATPVQELGVDRRLVFTEPQETRERLAFLTLSGAYQANATTSLESLVYVRRLRQGVVNGNTTGAVACADPAPAGQLCQPDALTPLISTTGAPIPDLSQGGATPIGELDRERLRSLAVGGSVQFASSAPVARHANAMAAGVSLDRATTDFGADAELGVIDASLDIAGSGFVIATPETSAFTATPVALHAVVTDLGVYATDTLDVTDRLSITVSGRYNHQADDLRDRMGAALTGRARYQRFNLAAGMAYRVSSGLTVYAGYAEANRAPSPSEIECADPARPCLLPSSLASDPPTLRQVVSRTYEAGLRGTVGLGRGDRLAWRAGVFRADLSDDIWGVATALGAGYFVNIGGTRRQGVDVSADLRLGRVVAFAAYDLVDATFRSPFIEASPFNPGADADGDVAVRPDDRLPGVPRHRVKAGVDYVMGAGWSAGADLVSESSQVYRGDEANALAPLAGHVVASLHAAWRWRALEVFISASNLFDARYATFGVLGDPTGVGAPGVPAANADPRFQSPAAPRAIIGGVRARF